MEILEQADFGAMALLVVLAERVDLQEALTAVTGWGGDAYVVFRQDGRTCARIDVTGDTPADTAELEAALRRWAEAGPEGNATVTRNGDLVRVDSCDPGAAASAGSGRSLDALRLVNARSPLAIQGLEQGFGRTTARCFSNTLATEMGPDEISSDNPSAGALRIARQILEECDPG